MADYILNPVLHRALSTAFPDARISVINAGQPLEGYYETEPDDRNPSGFRKRLRVVRRGETYVLNCFHCGDQRGRMAVNHRYGVFDPETGFKGRELWKCYNEECQGKPDVRAELRDKIDRAEVDPRGVRVRVPSVTAVTPGRLPPCEFPGLLVSLTDLPPDHKAAAYVRDRGFDPAELAGTWRIGYAQSVPSRARGAGAQDRLICPVHLDGVMVGYQARYIGELDWKATGVPKYLTYFPKSQTLYGIDEAEDASTVVLVEGVTDVWRYGRGAVSPLGKSLSFDQARLLAEHLRGRTLVVAPDSDDAKAFDAFVENVKMVSAATRGGVRAGLAVIPAGMDPAGLSSDTLRASVARGVAAAVTVS